MSERLSLRGRLIAWKQAMAARPGRLWFVGLFLVVLLLAYDLRLVGQSKAARRSELEHQFWVLCHGDSPAQERVIAFRALVAAGHAEWRSAHLYGLNLEDAFLPEADLQGADFTSTSLARAILVGAKLTKSRLQQADLTEADLSRADLAGAELYRAVLKQTQLRQANLRGALLQVVAASEANLQGADLSDTQWLMANLSAANLSGANLSGANLEAAVLTGANLFLTRLSGAALKDADFTDANWWRARGLTADQIALLNQKFTPTGKAAPSLLQDYQDWLKTPRPPQ